MKNILGNVGRITLKKYIKSDNEIILQNIKLYDSMILSNEKVFITNVYMFSKIIMRKKLW